MIVILGFCIGFIVIIAAIAYAKKKEKEQVEFLKDFIVKYTLSVYRDDTYLTQTPIMEARIKATSSEDAQKKLNKELKQRCKLVPKIKVE